MQLLSVFEVLLLVAIVAGAWAMNERPSEPSRRRDKSDAAKSSPE
jgi:hypothetical protein